MNRDTLLQLIMQPERIGKAELEELEALSERYPWFFPARQLQLFYHRSHNDIHFGDHLSRWALYCPFPKELYRFLNPISDDETRTEDTAMPAKVEVVPEVRVVEPEETIQPVEVQEAVSESIPEIEIVQVAPEQVAVKEVETLTAILIEETPSAELPAVVEDIEKTNQADVSELPESIIPPAPVAEDVNSPAPVPEITVSKTQNELIPEEPLRQGIEHESDVVLPESSPEPEAKPVCEKSEIDPVEETKTLEKMPDPENKQETTVVKPPEPVKKEKPVVPAGGEGESLADKVLRRMAELKKKREEEARKRSVEEIPVTKVIPEEAKPQPISEPAPIQAVEEQKADPVVFEGIPESVSEKHIESAVLPEVKTEICEAEACQIIESVKQEKMVSETPVDLSISEPETIKTDVMVGSSESGASGDTAVAEDIPLEIHIGDVEEEDEPVVIPSFGNRKRESLPFEIVMPPYDLSELEKMAAEKEDESSYRNRKMDFNSWLDAVNHQLPSKSVEEKDHSAEIIDRFIQQAPRIVIRHNMESTGNDDLPLPEEESDSPAACSETLADILVMQRKYDEAKSMYEKLSLLYPEKSVYFAAQIEKVTNHQV